ncbi:alpha-tubulin N-acetyltransferase-like [Prorops nasuta]|uniref:alpha-tubulin N-acetyltransferase-like n=1 Tax=Prorops nasuta TaxID=863751 RepID=UPI0034CDF5A8
MEFKFNVNKILPRKINKVTQKIIPDDFKGDRRELNEYHRQLSKILDDMGEASAKAQGLQKPITSAQKLRDTDNIIYLLTDSEANNGLGSVVGLLKTGSKHLFMFDDNGAPYRIKPRCVLDFYVHESRQRMGLGNMLYEFMLNNENLRPVKLAIDRPSEKFLAFLHKYYGLSKAINQNNNFVVFHGFFDDESQDVKTNKYSLPARSSLENTSTKDNRNGGNSVNGVYGSGSRTPYGRYAAARPPCSMANIIHNTAVIGHSVERTGDTEKSQTPHPSSPASQEEDKNEIAADEIDANEEAADGASQTPKIERPRSLSLYSEEEQKQRENELTTVPTPTVPEKEPVPYNALLLEGENPQEKTVKPSPTCAQEVTGSNQHAGHLDLKFYHSPLW